MIRTSLFLEFISLGLLCACGGMTGSGGGGTPPVQPTDDISGTVTFKGAPLAGAIVTSFMTNTNTVYGVATTDANGKYAFTGIKATGNVPGDYQIWVNKTGYAFYPSVGSGATVKRADYTDYFQHTGIADIAIYFTVIDFVALEDNSVSNADFAAYDGSNPLVSLAATGQQTSYAAGDDASQQKGVAWPSPRFTNNEDGTVTDSLTGLIWLQDAGCFAATTWSAALADVNQLSSGACGLSDGSVAGQWRLPNINELESLIDVSASGPALPAQNYFANVSEGVYWSSTSYFGGETGSPEAWTIRLSDGRYMNDSNANVKATANNGVWAVKGTGGGAVKLRSTGFSAAYTAGDDGSIQSGVPLTSPRFLDNGNGTVTDSMTGLIWLKQADCIHGTWSDAMATIQKLATGRCGLSDNSTAGSWRMPNRNEMQSLSDRMETNHADYFDQKYVNEDGTVYQYPIFINFMVSQYYWTSTTDAADPTEAWTVYSCDFGVYDISKANPGYTLAVR